MDFLREESLIVVKISEAIQQGRLNPEAAHATARIVALAAHTHHWTTGFVLDRLGVPADAPERGLWWRSVPALVSAIAEALPKAEAALEESDAELRAEGFTVPERERPQRKDSVGDVRIGDDVFMA